MRVLKRFANDNTQVSYGDSFQGLFVGQTTSSGRRYSTLIRCNGIWATLFQVFENRHFRLIASLAVHINHNSDLCIDDLNRHVIIFSSWLPILWKGIIFLLQNIPNKCSNEVRAWNCCRRKPLLFVRWSRGKKSLYYSVRRHPTEFRNKTRRVNIIWLCERSLHVSGQQCSSFSRWQN